MNKMAKILVAMVLVSSFSGCESMGAAIRRKFIPKKKNAEKRKVFYAQEEEYKPEFSNATIYNNHFVYWKSWEGELIEALKEDNEKKQISCAVLSLNELMTMQKYLTSPKKEELAPFVGELEKMVQKISASSLSPGARATLRVSLERHRRAVARDFYFNKVKGFVRPDGGSN